MLPTIIGVGFAGLLTLIGYLGKRSLDAFDAIRDDVGELRTDVAVLFERFGMAQVRQPGGARPRRRGREVIA